MIEIKNVSKTFKNGKNKIKAIDDTNLKLDSNGLVALLGPSGCGKTTLLNAIGGLDKVKKGNIYISNQKITSSLTSKKDRVRNNSIGYIFQDYKLINYMTVFENVELVLKMIGVKNKKERTERVEFVLDKVGMLRYKRRPCSMLSGGERQRVAIARALVKDPDIILADEPTGNLDSKNSLEIMKIISSIAKDRLVLLVTHEESLANFYATRIIRISDGKIESDELNKDIDDIDYIIENRIYLKDFNNTKKLNDKNYDINIYMNNEDKPKFDIIIKNGNIYIKSLTKVEIIDDSSNVEIIDDHYKKLSKEELEKYSFNLKDIIKTNKKKYSSIFNPISLLKNGFIKVFKYTILRKILLAGFFVSSMFTLFAFSAMLGTRDIDEKDFIKSDKNYVTAIAKLTNESYLALKKEANINLIIPGKRLKNMNIFINNYYQVSTYQYINSSISSLNIVDENKIIAGRMPEKLTEILVDKAVFDQYLNTDNSFEANYEFKLSGILEYEDVIGLNVSPDYFSGSNENFSYEIVGVYDGGNLSYYFDELTINNVLTLSQGNLSEIILGYETYENELILSSGVLPINDYEVIISENEKDMYKLNSEIELNKQKYKVVGYYSNTDYHYAYFTNDNTIAYNLIDSISDIAFHVNDKNLAIDTLKSYNINAVDEYAKDRENYIENIEEDNQIINTIALITLGISIMQIFLIVRASFLSRIKEVGIYRAIGVKKGDIYKMFIGEIIAISILVSLPGLITMTYILTNLPYIKDIVLINSGVIIGTYLFTVVVNLFIGLLPVYNTIRKTPAYILSRQDIE